MFLKLEAIDDGRRHQYGGGKPRNEIVQPSLAGAVPHKITPRGRQQGTCSSTLCGRPGFKPARGLHARRTRSLGGGWSSGGPTRVWLHGHDLSGKAQEITRARKLYGLARYYSRIESVARMHGMKVPASIEAASRQDWAVRTTSTTRKSESPVPARSNLGARLPLMATASPFSAQPAS
jgi:hypothetical protein